MNFLTKRLPTFLGLVFLFAIAGGLWWFLRQNSPIISEETRPQKVRITNVADNKFSISWVTTVKTEGSVEYGPVGQKLSQIGLDDRDASVEGQYQTHHVTLEGLQPSTQYAFRIISGSGGAKFDNNGSPYSATTLKVIGTAPPAASFYGEVALANGQAPEGAIVYVALPGAQAASVLVKSSGSYSIPISTIRSNDGNSYAKYDPLTTVAAITVEDGVQTAQATVLMEGTAPVPVIMMGQTHDFRTIAANEPEAVEPEVAEVQPERPTIFNVEPLGETSETAEVRILNPGTEGENVATTLPEFRGLAPEGTTLSITVHSITPYSDTVTVGSDGTWEWTPPSELEDGEHTITIAYVDIAGIERTITRAFTVSTALAQAGDPSFESTPSAGTASPSPSPTLVPSPTSSGSATVSASPRVSSPSTESGVPVTGVFEITLLTGALGIVIILLGAILLVL